VGLVSVWDLGGAAFTRCAVIADHGGLVIAHRLALAHAGPDGTRSERGVRVHRVRADLFRKRTTETVGTTGCD
jgi:hypothetical protein